MKQRLDKFLAHYGLGTRKEVKNLIHKGHVSVNNETIRKEDLKIDPEQDTVIVNEQVINYKQYIYIMLNKPAGYVSATKDNLHPTVIDLIKGYQQYDLFPAGRLDKDTEGLLIITNDGDFSHKLLSPKRHHSKIYYAIIDGIMTCEDVKQFKEGITIDNYQCFPANLDIIHTTDNQSDVYIEIFEGKFHQIKKMVKAVGKKVIYLKRLEIKSLVLDKNLQPGQYRELTDDELFDLKKDL